MFLMQRQFVWHPDAVTQIHLKKKVIQSFINSADFIKSDLSETPYASLLFL